MATLDQLSDDQRAIIELLLERRSSYGELSEMLDMPASRVRDHARSALVALAPRTAESVDPQWRGQVADYLLGQQTGPESKATRAHLKSSEQARSWALSALDSLDHLYANGTEPFIPAGGRAPKGDERPKAPPPPPKRSADARKRPKARDEGPSRRPTRSSDAPAEPAKPAATAPAAAAAATESATPRRRAKGVQAALGRRRGIVLAVALVAVAAVVVLAILLIGGGGEDPTAAEEPAPTETTPTTAELPPLPAALALQPVEGANAQGQAILAEQEGQTILIVRAVLPPSARDQVYEVWLYNDQEDAVPVGAQVTDKRGAFQGAGAVPENFAQYRYIDVSLEKADGDTTHGGNSVLRGELATAQPTSAGAAPQGAPAPGGGDSGGGSAGGGSGGSGQGGG